MAGVWKYWQSQPWHCTKMKTWIFLGFTLLASSFHPAAAGWHGPIPKPDPSIRPLLECSTDRDCDKVCKKYVYPEACEKMTHCDRGNCNDLKKCEHDEDCEPIGDMVITGSASRKCEPRGARTYTNPSRCYFTGIKISTWKMLPNVSKLITNCKNQNTVHT